MKKKASRFRLRALARKKKTKKVVGKRKARPLKPKAQSLKPSRWVKFVEKHGVVLASARGTVPSVAEQVAGEPIVGSWWAHPKGKAIFAALSELDDSDDVRCFKLLDGKVTFVHRRAWPVLVRLARAGELEADRVASVQQEHLPTGEHRNFVTPFPEWVDDATAKAADKLTLAQARAALELR